MLCTPPKKTLSRTPRQRMAERRDRRDPKLRADLRRQAKLMAQHPENDAIDAWIEAACDWGGWK
ncbi:MAG: DUF3018 domain-containing protein [Bradyrhizobium sp.]|nr:DUF3018 domain-containing protein [Bradyrhizobium sp.]